jgi:hypothetical protein
MPLRLDEQYPYYADRIGEARNEGFNDDEIFDWIQGRVVEAQEEGFSTQEIYDFMGSPQGVQPLTEADLSGSDAISGAEQPPPEPIEPYSILRPDAISEADAGQGPIRTRHTLEPEEEMQFQEWYKGHATKWGLNKDPDDVGHKYDYRGAYLEGEEPDSEGHWSSKFKDPDHPNRFVDGVDTITGLSVEDFNQDLPGAELRAEKREEEQGFLDKVKELADLPLEQILPGGIGVIVDEGLKQGKKLKKAITRNPAEEAARAQNILGVSRALEIPIEAARKDYDKIIEGLGLKGGPETVPGLAEEMATTFMLAPITASVLGATSAGGVLVGAGIAALGIAEYMMLSEGESYIAQKTLGEEYKAFTDRKFSELLPEEYGEFARDSVDLLSFIAKIKALGMQRGLFGKGKAKANKLFEHFTKEIVTEYGIPKKYYFRPSEVDAVFKRRVGQKVNPQAEAIIKDLMGKKKMSGKEVQEAINKGLEVEITADKIVRVADKPYWARIKSLFGLKPTSREISSTAGGKIETRIPKRALPPAGKEKGKKPPTQPPPQRARSPHREQRSNS